MNLYIYNNYIFLSLASENKSIIIFCHDEKMVKIMFNITLCKSSVKFLMFSLVDGKCVMNLSQMKENIIAGTIKDPYNADIAVHIWDPTAREAEIEGSIGLIGQPT